jgi:capsular exopolysaccharide synthesis family protein
MGSRPYEVTDVQTHHQALESATAEPAAIQAGHGILEIVWERKSYFALGVVVALVIGLLYYVQATPVYQSRAQVLVVKKHPDNVTGMDTRHLVIEDYVATHQMLIKSPVIIEQAIQKRNLGALESFAGKDDLVETILKALTVARNKATGATSNILDLSFRATQPADSATVLNAIIDCYKDFLDEKYRNTSEDTLKLVTKARDVLNNDLLKQKAAYRKFREQAPLLLLRGKEGTNLTQERLSSIEAKRSILLVRKAELQGQLQAIETGMKKGGSRETLLAMIAEWPAKADAEGHRFNDRLTLQNQLYPLLQEEQRLLETRGEQHPETLALRKRIEVARAYLASPSAAWRKTSDGPGAGNGPLTSDTLETFRDYFKQQLNHVELSEKLLASLFKEEYDAAKALTAYELEDEGYRTDIALKEKLYDGLIKRLQDVDLVKEVGGYDASIIAPPNLGKKIHPSALLVFAVACFLGMLGGLGLAYLAERKDKSFRSIEEVRRRLGLTVVGQIPAIRGVERNSALMLANNGRALAPILCTHHRPQSIQAESYRGVRTALFFNTHGDGPKVIQITSPNSGDGKSTLAANLGVSIAQSGKKVLLIDADLRKGVLHRLFGLSGRVGLTSVIADDGDPRDAIQESGIAGLSILTSGPLPHNPADVLTSPRFTEFLAFIREQYDFVILDTPPLLAVTDPSVVAPRVDGVILTVRLTKNGRPHAERAKEMLATLGITVFGVVVNDVHRRSGADLYGYGYGNGNEGYLSEGPAGMEGGTMRATGNQNGVHEPALEGDG